MEGASDLIDLLLAQVFLAGNATPRSNLALLDKMIATRTEMAETVGCSSYSEYKALDASLPRGPRPLSASCRRWRPPSCPRRTSMCTLWPG